MNVALRFQRIIVVFRGSYHKGADVSSVIHREVCWEMLLPHSSGFQEEVFPKHY